MRHFGKHNWGSELDWNWDLTVQFQFLCLVGSPKMEAEFQMEFLIFNAKFVL